MYEGANITIINNDSRGGHIIQGNNIAGSIYLSKFTSEEIVTILRCANNLPDSPNPREQEISCIRTIYLTDPRTDRENIISENGPRVDGTCEWITHHETYISWLHSRSQLLWLSGSPGQGKTTLSIYLAEVLESWAKRSQNAIFLEYYFKSQDDKHDNATAAMRGLIYQLLNGRPELFRHILPKFEAQQESLLIFETLWTVFEKMICDPVLGDIYCIIDALDECEEPSLIPFLAKLRFLFSHINTSSPQHLNLVVVSREFPGCIPKELSEFAHIQLNSGDDILKFIESKVEILARHRQYPTQLSSYVKKVFLERAQGTFLWVGIVARQLETYALSEVGAALDQFPSGLEQVYARMLAQIDESRVDVVARMLLWIVLAVRPLTVGELSAVLGIKASPSRDLSPDHITKDYVKFCGSLLKITNSTVHLVHLSAKDYLMRGTPDCNPRLERLRIKEHLGNLEIATKCLSYLKEGHVANGKGNLGQHQRQLERNPLRSYAIRYWHVHARSLSSSESIFDLSNSFYQEDSPARRSWLQAYSSASATGFLSSFPLLHMACCFGITPLVHRILHRNRWLKKLGILYENLNDWDGGGCTPLVQAVKNRHLSVVRLLLQHPKILADRPTFGPDGKTPLYIAVELGHSTIVEALLQRQDIAADRRHSHLTPLMAAAVYGRETITTLLLQRRETDINSKDDTGRTALHWAIMAEQDSVAQLLLHSPNILPNIVDEDGDTPLLIAVRRRNNAIIELLLEREDVVANLPDNRGMTPLLYAAREGHEEIVKLLVARSDVDINWISPGYLSTALGLAAYEGHDAVVRLLLERADLNPNIPDGQGRTPLASAAMKSHEAIVRLLLGRPDIMVNSRNRTGWTPLSSAASNGHTGIVALLLERQDVHVNSQNEEGRSALHLAAWRGQDAVVPMLLKRPDIAPDQKDILGWTPLCCAALGSAPATIGLLLERSDVDIGWKEDLGELDLYRKNLQADEKYMPMRVLENLQPPGDPLGALRQFYSKALT